MKGQSRAFSLPIVAILLLALPFHVYTSGGCSIELAEHPTLTTRAQDVVFCGGMYTYNSMQDACSTGWHICNIDEIIANYPIKCDPYTNDTSFGLKQSVRCNQCTRPSYLAETPFSDEKWCGNLDSLKIPGAFTGYQPYGDGKMLQLGSQTDRSRKFQSDDTRAYFTEEMEDFPTEDSWREKSLESLNFAVYCCSNSENYPGSHACDETEAEHPSFTTVKRNAALCGGEYDLGNYEDACASNWHVCTMDEWILRYNASSPLGTWPKGNISTFGASQLTRGIACPNQKDGWLGYEPYSSRYFCGDICHKAEFAESTDAVALLDSNNYSIIAEDSIDFVNNWLDLKYFSADDILVKAFSVVCCRDGLSTDGSTRCPVMDTQSSFFMFVFFFVFMVFLILFAVFLIAGSVLFNSLYWKKFYLKFRGNGGMVIMSSAAGTSSVNASTEDGVSLISENLPTDM